MTERQPEPVLITALGLVTPWGLGREALRAGLAGQSLPDPARCPQMDLKDYLPGEKTYLDRCSELALAGASLALEDAGLLGEDKGLRVGHAPSDPLSTSSAGALEATLPRAAGESMGSFEESFGIGLGTAWGCLDTMAANSQRVQGKGTRLASPLLFMHSFINAPASLVAIEWGLRGPAATFAQGGLSGACALLWARDLLARGAMDRALVGGVEALSEPLRRAVAAEPALAQGGTPLEAAVLFLLERAEAAQERGARPLARLESVSLVSTGETPVPPGPAKWYAFGANFALRLAVALVEPGTGARTIQEVEGGQLAKVEVVLA